ncbi:hypothetical protein GB937_009312 [Aspergillus fischeri]|nr:hypothetical protein GB937_009312 [Aspergillus fischeri]
MVLSTIQYPPTPGSASPPTLSPPIGTSKNHRTRRLAASRDQSGDSIADHVYRISIMVMLCAPSLASRVNTSRCIQMALVHDMADMAECLVGYHQGRKTRREEATTMGYIAQLLPGVTDINTFTALFRGYEENQTLEAQLVHDINKLERVLQTFEYERCHQRDLSEFYHVMDAIRLPEMRDWGLMMMEEREAFQAATSKGEIENDLTKT